MVTVRRMSDLPAWPDAPMDTLLRDAVEWAQQMPDPKPEDALGYVYREVL